MKKEKEEEYWGGRKRQRRAEIVFRVAAIERPPHI
jgi:hypothetical protein